MIAGKQIFSVRLMQFVGAIGAIIIDPATMTKRKQYWATLLSGKPTHFKEPSEQAYGPSVPYPDMADLFGKAA
jgi:hypothetical protein